MSDDRVLKENQPDTHRASPDGKNKDFGPSVEKKGDLGAQTAWKEPFSHTIEKTPALSPEPAADEWDGLKDKAEEYAKGGRRVLEPQQSSKKKAFLGIGIALAAIVVCAVAFACWGLFGFGGVYPGVTMLGIKSSGAGAEPFVQSVASQAQALYKDYTLPIVINETEYTVGAAELPVRVDEEEAARVALAYGREGNVGQRISRVCDALFGGVELSVPLKIEESDLMSAAERIAKEAEDGFEEPSYEIKDGVLYLDAGSLGFTVSTDELLMMLRARLEAADFSPLGYEAYVTEPSKVNFDRLLSELAQEKRDAYLDLEKDPTGNTIAPHVDQITFDVEVAQEAYENRTGRTVEIPVDVVHPDITTEHLKEVLFRDTLSDISSSLNANLVGRTGNVRLAASFCNGKILNPGDSFSFNDTVGKRTAERGFKMAKVYKMNEVVDDLGGGICQVSSGLYLAAALADMEIAERHNHRYTVAYAKLGEDATVSYGHLDFKFVNNSPYPIKIVAKQEGSKLYVTFLGTKTKDEVVSLSTKVLSSTPFEKKTVEDPNLPYGQTKSNNGGYKGYVTETYRVYKDKNGKTLRSVFESKSNYVKLDKITTIGTKGKPAEQPAVAPGVVEQPTTTDPVVGTGTLPTESPVAPATW